MKNNKLFLLISALKPEEYKSFSIFIQSSFFTKSKDVIRLWSILARFQKRSQLKKLDREQLFILLFPQVEFSDIKLRNLFRKLTKVLEDFLILKELQNKPTDREIMLNKIYRRRNLFSIFEKSGKKLSKELENVPERGSHYFLENYQWKKQHYFHPNTDKNTNSILELQEAFYDLHYFYSIEKLHMEVELKNQERIYKKQYDQHFFDVDLKHFTAPILLEKVSNLISSQGLKIYKEVKTLFYEKLKELSEGDRNVSYTAMLNFLITKSRIDPKKYNHEIFTLYKTGIEQRIIFSDNKVSGITFSNIVTLASQLSYFDWAEDFINTFSNNISDSNRSDFITISKGQLLFHQQQYDQTLSTILNYNFKNYRYNYIAKTLTIKTYYEQFLKDKSYTELVENAILSFEKQIRRDQKASGQQKEYYQNFASTLLLIFKNKKALKQNNQGLKKISDKIKNLKNVSNKTWLQEKTSGNR